MIIDYETQENAKAKVIVLIIAKVNYKTEKCNYFVCSVIINITLKGLTKCLCLTGPRRAML